MSATVENIQEVPNTVQKQSSTPKREEGMSVMREQLFRLPREYIAIVIIVHESLDFTGKPVTSKEEISQHDSNQNVLSRHQ